MSHRTGILGGTFDPVHNGHIALALAAADLCNLSEIVFLPAAVPPHKQNQKITTFSHRVAMLDIAAGENPLFCVSTIEKLLPAPSYTIDTLQYLRIHSVGKTQFYFIIGADAFLDILLWHKYEEVLMASHFIVFSRDGCRNKKLYKLLAHLNYNKNKHKWYNKKLDRYIYTSTLSLPSVSSSEIRKKIASGKAVKKFVPPGVAQYIGDHKLYRD